MHVQRVLYLFSHKNEGIAPPIVIKTYDISIGMRILHIIP
jgi:hypothetical protein